MCGQALCTLAAAEIVVVDDHFGFQMDPRNHEFRYVSILDWSNHWIWGYIHFRKDFLFFIHGDSWF